MAEQNLVAIAAGLARTGKVPFATTYGVFATRRAYDFIAIAVAHSRVNVKIVAGLPGLTTGYGGTHQAIEDLALMRMVPNLTVIDPCDASEITQATNVIAAYDGPVYMRLLRGAVPVVLDASEPFVIGKARLLRKGGDIGIISTGFMTERALDAATALDARGIRAGVLHVPTIKPFDAEAVCAFASSVGHVVSAENHVVVGGLGSLVAEALFTARIDRQLTRVGLPDQFIECGSVPTLQARYGISTEAMVATLAGLQ
jgi:transketolase